MMLGLFVLWLIFDEHRMQHCGLDVNTVKVHLSRLSTCSMLCPILISQAHRLHKMVAKKVSSGSYVTDHDCSVFDRDCGRPDNSGWSVATFEVLLGWRACFVGWRNLCGLEGFRESSRQVAVSGCKGQATMLVAPLCSRLGSGTYRRSRYS